jgi:succinate dehydrogenase hydrophobic anchor subunit
MLVLLMGKIYEVQYIVEMVSCGMLYVPIFMKTDTDIQAIFRFCFSIFEKFLMLVLLMGVIYEVHRLNGLRWHDIRTSFHYDRFRYLSNTKVITATI